MTRYVQPLTNKPNAGDLHGRKIEFEGMISFRWKVLGGKTIHPPTEFLVAITEIDLIFGLKYIVEKSLLIPNWSSVMPLIEHSKEDLCMSSYEYFMNRRWLIPVSAERANKII